MSILARIKPNTLPLRHQPGYAFYLPSLVTPEHARNLAEKILTCITSVGDCEIYNTGLVILYSADADLNTVAIERKLREWHRDVSIH